VSKATELGSGQITSTESITIELVEADQTRAVVIVRWPTKASVFHPRRFPGAADVQHASSLPQSYGWQRSNGSAGCQYGRCGAGADP
jgi:hypothetical protein